MLIHKQVLEIRDEQVLLLPASAEFLHVDDQYGQLTAWYQFEPTNSEARPFRVCIVGTGKPFDRTSVGSYLGTAVVDAYVWHVFVRAAN